MLSKQNCEKIDEVLHNTLPIIFQFDFNGVLFLMGGALRDIYFGMLPKDIDFILLTQENNNIKEFIDKFSLEYSFNSFGTYKAKYKEIIMDIVPKNDLYNAMVYNIDGLFYDVKNGVFIPFGFNDCFERQVIDELNPRNFHSNEARNIERRKKLDKFFKDYNVKNGK